MSKTIKIALILVLAVMASYSIAHSGRTDSKGGHNCSEASKKKSLCSGYHYHYSTSAKASSANKESEHDHKASHEHKANKPVKS